MLNAEWNMDEALRVRGEEEREEGRKEGYIEAFCDAVASGAMKLEAGVRAAKISRAEFMGWMNHFHPSFKV